MGPSLFELVLVWEQLRDAPVRYIFGTGPMGRYACQHLSPAVAAKVQLVSSAAEKHEQHPSAITLRKFCECASPSDSVLFASPDTSQQALLAAFRQSHVLDTRELYRSERFRGQGNPSRDAVTAVISTIPRSGTFRIRYCLFALNEILRTRARHVTPEKLYLYHLADWSNPRSPYYTRQLLELLMATALRIGHYVPPGALAVLAHHPVAKALQADRVRAFRNACSTSPELAAASHPARPWDLEPPLEVLSEVRYALVARNLFDQLVSSLTVLELALRTCEQQGARDWTLEALVRHCGDRLRPYVFAGLQGLAPLLFQQCLQQNRLLCEVVATEGHLRSLIVDFVLQVFACLYLQKRVHGVQTRLFLYDDMVQHEATFFRELTTFLRGTPPDDEQLVALAAAIGQTSSAHMRRLEQRLGHSLFFRHGLQRVFDIETHLTSWSESSERIRAVRETVHRRLEKERSRIETEATRLWYELCGAEAGIAPVEVPRLLAQRGASPDVFIKRGVQ